MIPPTHDHVWNNQPKWANWLLELNWLVCHNDTSCKHVTSHLYLSLPRPKGASIRIPIVEANSHVFPHWRWNGWEVGYADFPPPLPSPLERWRHGFEVGEVKLSERSERKFFYAHIKLTWGTSKLIVVAIRFVAAIKSILYRQQSCQTSGVVASAYIGYMVAPPMTFPFLPLLPLSPHISSPLLLIHPILPSP